MYQNDTTCPNLSALLSLMFSCSTNCRVLWLLLAKGLCSRVHPKIFDQVGHQTTNASIGNKHFFNK